MFSFIKLFRGRKAVAVENIAHDRVTELIFETMPQVKEDFHWSFTVQRYVPVLLLLLLPGCAIGLDPYREMGREEVVREMSLERQLNAYIDDYYRQVVGLCVELHRKARAGQSPVDCGTRLHQLHLSFPSRAYYAAHLSSINQLYQHWCAAAGSKLGRSGVWVRYFRRERVIQSKPCIAKESPAWPNRETGGL